MVARGCRRDPARGALGMEHRRQAVEVGERVDRDRGAVAAELGQRRPQRLRVAAVGGEEKHAADAVAAERADRVAQDRHERRRLQVERAGKRQVLARAADGQGGTGEGVADLGAQAFGERVRDDGVGVEREMGSVLLRRAERQDGRAAAPGHERGDLGPDVRRHAPADRQGRHVVERPLATAARPSHLVDGARLQIAQQQRVQLHLVLEETEWHRQRCRQPDQRVSLRLEHGLQAREERLLLGRVRAREGEKGRGRRESLLERSVRQLERIPHRRHGPQHAFEDLPAQVADELGVRPRRDERQRCGEHARGAPPRRRPAPARRLRRGGRAAPGSRRRTHGRAGARRASR